MRIILIVLLAFTMQGCTALAIGGAAAAGYQVGKDEREPGVIAADTAITTKIKSKYAVDSTVSVFNVGVRTYEGRVTLTGNVGNSIARSVAQTLANETEGVISVDNRIQVIK